VVIAVWYCPVVMGKKTTGTCKNTTGTGKKTPQEWAKKHRNIMWYFLWYINCCVVLSCGNGQKTTGMGKKTTGIVCGFPIVH